MKVERDNHVIGERGLTKRSKLIWVQLMATELNCILYHKEVQGVVQDWCEWIWVFVSACIFLWICFSYAHVYVCPHTSLPYPQHVWVYLSGNETLDRRVIDSENLQINSWTAGAEEIRSEAQAAGSAVRQAQEQTVISGL